MTRRFSTCRSATRAACRGHRTAPACQFAQGANGGGGGLSQQQQLEINTTDFGFSFSTPFQRGFGSALSYVGRILAHDLAPTAVGILAKPIVLAQDLWDLGQSVWALDPASIARNALGTVLDQAIPTYGFYGGGGWGTRQFGNIGIPGPLNSVDWASLSHDISFRHLQWVRNVWAPTVPSLPPGPFGFAYGIIGTPPFALAGAFQ
jgi:hypothetical protein